MTLSWDDLRIFLAVIRHGSTKRAANALGIDQTTCARRIRSLESAVGMTLFDRKASGFALTDEGRALEPHVEAMGNEADSVAFLAAKAARGRQSVLRISVGDLLVEPVVQPALIRFRQAWPDVRVELAVENRYADIMNGEADIAIRPGDTPKDSNLIVRRLGGNPMGVYCTQAYADQYGIPTSITEFVSRPFACNQGRALSLITAYFPDRPPRFVASSLQPLVEAVSSGDLAAILPSPHADRMPGFIRCFPIEAETGSVWLVYHPSLRNQRPARDLLSGLTSAFKKFASEPEP